MVAIGNGGNVGGGTELNPDADPEDGRLDVMISRAVKPMAKLGYVVGLSRGTHDERDDVVTLRGRSVKVSGDEFWLSADGEISGPERSRSWRLEPAAYWMILPPPDLASEPAAADGLDADLEARVDVELVISARPGGAPCAG